VTARKLAEATLNFDNEFVFHVHRRFSRRKYNINLNLVNNVECFE